MDVYLLGAGFSGDAGVPTMKNFLQCVDRAAENLRDKTIHRILQRAVLFAREHHCENIESLLTKAHNEAILFDLIWAFALTVSYYSSTFYSECLHGHDPDWYEQFIEEAASSRARVLTLNYDLVIEQILWQRLQMRPDYHFSFTISAANGNTALQESKLSLYKLHGSVSWLWCPACGASVCSSQQLVFAAYEKQACATCHNRLIPLIIPPTFRKALDPANPLRRLWLQAQKLLRQADRIIIGGLSFADRDADFRELFLNCVWKNRSLQEVIIINRDAKICEKLGQLLPVHLSWRAVSGFRQFCGEHKQATKTTRNTRKS